MAAPTELIRSHFSPSQVSDFEKRQLRTESEYHQKRFCICICGEVSRRQGY